VLTVAITLVCIYIILVNVDTERLSRTFRTIPWYVFTASLSVHFLAYIFRALVFLKLLEKEKLGFRFVLLNHCIHNFYVHVVPASLGELSFPYLLRNRVSQGKSLLAVVVSRLVSMIFFVGLLLLSVLFIDKLAKYPEVQTAAGVLTGMGALALAATGVLRRQFLAVLERLKVARNRWLQKTGEQASHAFTYLASQKSLKSIGLLSLYTLLSVLAVTLHFKILFHQLGYALSLWEILFVSSIEIIFIVIPVKSIGGFGTVEGALTMGLLMLGFELERNIETSFVIHLITLFNVTLLFLTATVIKFLQTHAKA